jgi:hypothetical protein
MQVAQIALIVIPLVLIEVGLMLFAVYDLFGASGVTARLGPGHILRQRHRAPDLLVRRPG